MRTAVLHVPTEFILRLAGHIPYPPQALSNADRALWLDLFEVLDEKEREELVLLAKHKVSR